MCKISEDVVEHSGFVTFPARHDTYIKNGHFLSITDRRETGFEIHVWFVHTTSGERQDVFFGTVQTEIEFKVLLKMLNLLGNE